VCERCGDAHLSRAAAIRSNRAATHEDATARPRRAPLVEGAQL
jgi:hypothetical protein